MNDFRPLPAFRNFLNHWRIFAMSLSPVEWKTVLDKPKNLGLKAVGTGVSKVLTDCQTAMNEHVKNVMDKAGRDKLKASFQAVDSKCDEVIKKHEKLFTEACNHLKKVKVSVKKSLAAFTKEEPRYAALAAMQTRLSDLLPKLKAGLSKLDRTKILDQIDTNLKVGAANASKLKSVYNDFVKGRKEWEKVADGKPIHYYAHFVVNPAIQFNPLKK